MLFYIALTVALVVIDQLIKLIVRSHLAYGTSVELIPNLIDLTYQENEGISFSLLSNLPDAFRVPLLAGISLIVVTILCGYAWLNWPKLIAGERWGYSLIISGAVGNLIDRAFRKSVTDYMYFHFYDTGFFVNNLADDLISIGFILLLYQAVRGSKSGSR